MIRVNIFGLLTGFLMLYLALAPEPWWVAKGGAGGEALHAYLSPFMFDLTILGKPVEIPIVYWLNLASRIAFVLAAIETIFISIIIYQEWCKSLLSLRALWASILFPIILAIGLKAAENLIGLSIPIYGEALLTYNLSIQDYTILSKMPIRTYFTPTFGLAVATGVISLFARGFHKVLVKTEPSIPST